MYVAALKSTTVDRRTRPMENNVIFHNVPDEKNEDCQKLVQAALDKAGYQGSYEFEKKIHKTKISIVFSSNFPL